MAGRPKALTPKQVNDGINRYFKSITITKPLFDSEVVGEDEKGKTIYKQTPRLNNLGKQLEYIEYTEHPTMIKLAHYLKINKDTLVEYGKQSEYSVPIKKAKEIIEGYLENKLYGNNVTGIIFNLKNNYGWEDRTKHDIGLDKSLEDLLDEDD